MSGGLLIAGLVVPVPGLTIYNPLDTPWCRLEPGDFRPRRTKWIRQLYAHSTKGKWPQAIRLGAGAAGAAKIVADFFYKDPHHSAAQLVVDRDGSVACLADLATACAFHATTSNDWSVGIEMYQEADGSIYEAVYNTMVRLVPAVCDALDIPFQIAGDEYVPGQIITRMLSGGADCVGIFGHRDQAWDFDRNTSSRGRGDPGDEIYKRLIAAGAEPLHFGLRQDLMAWGRRQRFLNRLGEHLVVDGVCGPATIAAMRKHGFANGRAICP